MYLRYGDPSWDAPEPESADPTDPAVSPDALEHARRRRSGARSRSRSPAAARLPLVDVHGVGIHAITERQAIDHILSELDAARGGVVVTPNLDHLRRCRNDAHFEALVAEADLVLADGMPVVWASRIQGTPLPERVAGSSLISTLSEAAAKHGRSVFLLGGAEGTAEGAAKVLQERYPGLKIAGTYYPAPGFDRSKKEMADLRAALTASNADIVFVALGSPKQERLTASIKSALPAAWWLGVGISFSFLCGHVKRAPPLDAAVRDGVGPPPLPGAPPAVQAVPHGRGAVRRPVDEPGRGARRAEPPVALDPPVPPGRDCTGRPPRASPADANGRSNGHSFSPPAGNGKGNGHASGNGNSNGHARLGAEARAAASLDPLDPMGVEGLPRAPEDSGVAMTVPAVAPDRLMRLRALVLLGGSVRPSPLSIATGRSVLDLPLDEGGSLMNYWLHQAVEVTRMAGIERLPVRVMVNHASLEPTTSHERYYGTFRVERDLSEYRGTGGVLRDVAADYGDDDLILVANAAQVLLDPLAAIATALERQGRQRLPRLARGRHAQRCDAADLQGAAASCRSPGSSI